MYESQYLLELGRAMDYLLSFAVSMAAQEALKMTILSGKGYWYFCDFLFYGELSVRINTSRRVASVNQDFHFVFLDI